MLDYVLVNRKFRNSVRNVRAHRDATSGVGTDHHLLTAKVPMTMITKNVNDPFRRDSITVVL
jgi:endonuclease/exonuclease/phosphatase family metal-dependent hydrolase